MFIASLERLEVFIYSILQQQPFNSSYLTLLQFIVYNVETTERMVLLKPDSC